MKRWTMWLAVLALLAAACTPDETAETSTTAGDEPTTTTATPTTTAPPEPEAAPDIYLNLVWHQHQPRYPLDANGVVTRPWVRVHATKDYYDMASMLRDYPGVKATFNLTPILLLQLEELANGTKDIYWTTAEIPADSLSDTDKRFIMERFFDTNPRIVARFPRYQELADKRADAGGPAAPIGTFTADEYRDLQVLFNLGWTDPDFLEVEPLASLVARSGDYAEDDKVTLFAEHLAIIQAVMPLHTEMWNSGQIEVTTTPLAHPILPLLADSNLATIGDPAALLPDNRFQEIPDADQHVIRGLDTAERLLGRRPVGMWPGEGAVAQLVMSLFAKNDVEWVATGEDVLAPTLGIGSFNRDSNSVVEEAETLYKPWQAVFNRNEPVAMFFRDKLISDLVGFEYSGQSGQSAADDFMARLEDIRDRLGEQGALNPDQPPVVTITLDGENAWENYDNDGKDFLRALYENLAGADFVRTITPSEYLAKFGEPESLPDVAPASWFQPNFATWIGETEEATAWDYLYEVRNDLTRAERSGDYTEDQLTAAFEAMLFAEGSDWFWWYGSDQESGDDGYFDRAYRELLRNVYIELGDPPPGFLDVPIIPQAPVTPPRATGDLVTITVDGVFEGAWEDGGVYSEPDGAGFGWAYDKDNLYLRLIDIERPVSLYLGTPQGDALATTIEGEPLGYGATTRIDLTAGGLTCVSPAGVVDSCINELDAADGGDGIEVRIPLNVLGALEPGDNVLLKATTAGVLFPAAGPIPLQVPDISNVDVALSVIDPAGDDHGPGTYTYPTDGVFTGGSYDLTLFEVGTEDDDVVFTVEIAGTIQNPWNSPRGFSIQTFDFYIDTDPGAATGARLLIDGRNAALAEGNGWEYGITLEGWDPAIYVAAADGTTSETKPSFGVAVFGDKGKIQMRIDKSLLGDGDPSTWGFAVAVMSQEGFPSPGVRRVRDVESAAQQWRIGGAPNDINHTRIIDVISAVPGEQEASLANYTAVTSGELTVDDFGIIPLILPQ